MRELGLADVLAARDRIAPYLSPTPLRRYAELDAEIGHGLRVLVKHENHQPTCSFKVRNGLSALTALDDATRARGIVGASRGNHGQGLAYAGALLGVPVTICVPRGNSPTKNLAMRGLGAEVIEDGADYDESVAVAERLVRDRGVTMIHSTNDASIVAGAGTLALEIDEQARAQGERLDAAVIAVGGGSQAVGALTVFRERRPELPVFAVQAAAASAIHDGWHAGHPVDRPSANTFADGLATRHCYEGTFEPLRRGLEDFITVDDDAIAAAVRCLIRCTHNLAEGAGAAGLAGAFALAPRLAGKTIAVVLSGSNLDEEALRCILGGGVPG